VIKWVEDKRPQRFGWAPGSYVFVCRGCKHNGGKDREIIGDKRAIMCADCAYALPDPVKVNPCAEVLPQAPKVAELNELRTTVEAAIDDLTSWLLDRITYKDQPFEDIDPHIDDVRTALQDALQKLP
jgi:hypothetical protein